MVERRASERMVADFLVNSRNGNSSLCSWERPFEKLIGGTELENCLDEKSLI